MAAFEIGWSGPARRALARMPEKVATAAVEFIFATLAASPHRVGKPLRLEFEGLHSARRGGEYRLIYRVDGPRRQVEIVAIEHRADVYHPRRRQRRPGAS
ncbi:MAG: type II toxin-antitoxin system RelE family toxin [Natronosporangium sp.]